MGMRAKASAAILAVVIMTVLADRPARADAALYWVESHAISQGSVIGDRWDGSYDPADYPAVAAWEGISSGRGEFGTDQAASASWLFEGTSFRYAGADATWFDTITVYDPLLSVGDPLLAYLHFNLTGRLLVSQTGTRPADTVTEGRAAICADVTSTALGLAAHGYNMLSDKSDAGVVFHLSGNWGLGATAVTPSEYAYDSDLVLEALLPNAVEFDLLAKIGVATSVQMWYTGAGEFEGLGDYGLMANVDFAHSMILGGLTDAEGRDLRDSGILIGSRGPTFGGPIAFVPEPAAITLLMTGLAIAAFARWRAAEHRLGRKRRFAPHESGSSYSERGKDT